MKKYNRKQRIKGTVNGIYLYPVDKIPEKYMWEYGLRLIKSCITSAQFQYLYYKTVGYTNYNNRQKLAIRCKSCKKLKMPTTFFVNGGNPWMDDPEDYDIRLNFYHKRLLCRQCYN